MENKRYRPARYKIIAAPPDGKVFRFFCEASGAAVCTTKPIYADTEDAALHLAWEREGRERFNLCHACGKWVCDAMYNADTFNCVDCTPWEAPPKYCPRCGEGIFPGDSFCRKCGVKLLYGGGEDDKAV